MKKRIFALMLATVMVFSLVACGGDSGSSSNSSSSNSSSSNSSGSGYTGDLSIMHFSTSEESQGNAGSLGFRTVISDWKNANPGINLVEEVLQNDDYKIRIATRAENNDLPDIFLLQGMNTIDWANRGLVYDMTQAIADSPYNSQYGEYFAPFTADGKIYGLPVLTGGTCTLILYDTEAWKAAGFDSFPTTWDAIVNAKDNFGGAYPIAFGNSGQWQMNSCWLTAIGDRFTGTAWFQSIIDKGGAAFTDQAFVDALTFTQNIFASGIFNPDFNAINNEEARELYIAGEAAAFIGGNWDASYVGATLAEVDPDLLARTKFAVFPQPAGATAATNSHATTMGYAVAISSKVANDPAKLAAAIDFAYYVTGPAFAEFVAREAAQGGLTVVSNVDLSGFSQFDQDFYNYNYVDWVAAPVYDSHINGEVWGTLNADLQTMTEGRMTPQQVAENVQAVYAATY
jgi:multiple sugar transport system substrate-binding protein/raffinose/stachyose/melibiose transport system substrate-binding protein